MANGHGGARSGAGRKKGAKNRLTKEVKKTLTELASEYTSEALETLADVMKNGTNDSARVSAANSLLDRAHGKPIQATVEVSPENAPQVFDGFLVKRAKPDPADAD
jgi:hypothetical protein